MRKIEIDVNLFGAIEVYNDTGQQIPLSSLWEKNPAVLVFVRHFGWLICRQQVADLESSRFKFENKGVTLVVIGNGQSVDLEPFQKATGYHGVLLTDPERRAYQLLNFNDSITDLIGLKSFAAGFSALRSGHKPGAMKGSPMQLGGAVIITPDKKVVYYYQSGFAGDHPLVEDLLAAVSEPF